MNKLWIRLTAALLVGVVGVLALTVVSAQDESAGTGDAVQARSFEAEALGYEQIGTWQTAEAAGFSGESYIYSEGADALLRMQFAGSYFQVDYVTGPSLGTLVVEIDGNIWQTVATGAETIGSGSLVLDSLPAGVHMAHIYGENGGIGIDNITATMPVVETSSSAPPPANDEAVNATVVTSIPAANATPNIITGTSAEATKASNDPKPSCALAYGSTVWFQFTAPIDTGVFIDAGGSEFQTVLTVYGPNGSELDCDNGYNNTTGGTVVADVDAGSTYYVMLSAFGAGGNYSLAFSESEVPDGSVLIDGGGLDSPFNETLSTLDNPLRVYVAEDPQVTWYNITLTEPDGTVQANWYPAQDVCYGFGFCGLGITVTQNGTQSYSLQQYSPAGLSNPVSSVDLGGQIVPLEFAVDIPAPGDVTPVTPEDQLTIDGTNMVTFTWEPASQSGVSQPDWVNLVVDGPESLNKWYAASEVCVFTGTYQCSVEEPLYTNGAYTWTAQSWAWVSGFGPLSAASAFTLDIQQPGLIANIGPTGVGVAPQASVSWDESGPAVFYQVYLGTDDYSETLFFGWLAEEDICNDGICSLDAPQPLDGSYAIFIQGWSPAGFGGFNTQPVTFSTQGQADLLLSPTNDNTVGGNYLTFSWENFGSDAAWYQLYVSDAAFNQPVASAWYAATDEIGGQYGLPGICENGVCVITPEGTGIPANGDYTWFVRPYYANANALGAWVQGEFKIGDDMDSDGLADVEEDFLGTLANNPDTDGDSLPDGWEVHGYGVTDLAGYGADPLYKDLFVEMDYMVLPNNAFALAPNANVITQIEQVFADAPLSNPNGIDGINIILDLDDELPYIPVMNTSFDPANDDVLALQSEYFNELRVPVWHYSIWGDGYAIPGTSPGSSGISYGIDASVFIVTLGPNVGVSNGLADGFLIGTFIHELGHNLALTHGGNDNTNWKPNYLSIMNYRWQFQGVPRDNGATRAYDFQRFPIPVLDETNLDETVGLNSSEAVAGGYQTAKLCPPASAPNSATLVTDITAIDWNCDGDTTDTGLSVDLNADNSLFVLGSQDNWANLSFTGGGVIGVPGADFDTVAGSVQRSYERNQIPHELPLRMIVDLDEIQ